MQKPKIYIVSQPFYLEPFKDLFHTVENIRQADVVMFTGGEDVHPSLYREPVGRFTGTFFARDEHERVAFDIANALDLGMIGICRGSQFLTVMSGGKLVQDVRNHTETHEVFTEGGRTLLMSSTHHQMMNPFEMPKKDYHILAWAEGRSGEYLNGWNQPIAGFKERGIEPEVVWYPKTKALCIQPHPEIMRFDSAGVQYCRKLVKEYLL